MRQTQGISCMAVWGEVPVVAARRKIQSETVMTHKKGWQASQTMQAELSFPRLLLEAPKQLKTNDTWSTSLATSKHFWLVYLRVCAQLLENG